MSCHVTYVCIVMFIVVIMFIMFIMFFLFMIISIWYSLTCMLLYKQKYNGNTCLFV